MGERVKTIIHSMSEDEIVVQHEVGINTDMGYLTRVAETLLDGVNLLGNQNLAYEVLGQAGKEAVGQGVLGSPPNYDSAAQTLVDSGAVEGSREECAQGLMDLVNTNYRGIQERLAEKERQTYESGDFEGNLQELKKGTRIPLNPDGTESYELQEDYVAVDSEGDLIDSSQKGILLNVLRIRYVPKRLLKSNSSMDTSGDADRHFGSTEWRLEHEDDSRAVYVRESWTDILLYSMVQGARVMCFSRIGQRLLAPEHSEVAPYPLWYSVPTGKDDRTSLQDAAANTDNAAFENYAFWIGDSVNPYEIPVHTYSNPWIDGQGFQYREYESSFWPDVEDYHVSFLGGTWVSGKIKTKEQYIRYKREKIDDGGGDGGGEKPTGGGIPEMIQETEAMLEMFGIKTRTKEGLIIL